ncbi:hypothetical protein [uncultured Campylobacter sp.]|uniref:hypothetical protein n=1 Tax=uncultured Campylobacter sp. TaxID=218934 RepID=UPI0026242A69|nr:hypothetical protein [uncultured Campylobacter sp.]
MIKFRLRRIDTKQYAAQLNRCRRAVWQNASSPIRITLGAYQSAVKFTSRTAA